LPRSRSARQELRNRRRFKRSRHSNRLYGTNTVAPTTSSPSFSALKNHIASGAETTLYWGIWDSGQTASGAISNIAMLNTLPIQAVGSTPQPNGFPPGTLITKVYRSCSGQSLYLWQASSAARLPNDDIVVRFSDAVEQPLTTP
jgi:hypothetical protein